MPHWLVTDSAYFVTICAYGAIPSQAAKEIRSATQDLKAFSGNELLNRKRMILRKTEEWLDRKEAPSFLTEIAIAQMLMEAIEHRVAKEAWRVYEFVIMPSHLHLLVEPINNALPEVLKEFKRFTGRCGVKLVSPRLKRFWADEWFDHWVRSPQQGERIMEYIRNNPVKAGLVQDYQDWPYGSWSRLVSPPGPGGPNTQASDKT